MKKPLVMSLSLFFGLITTVIMFCFNFGFDTAPGDYYIGGPLLLKHPITEYDSPVVNYFVTGAKDSVIILMRLAIALGEGLAIWLLSYAFFSYWFKPAPSEKVVMVTPGVPGV